MVILKCLLVIISNTRNDKLRYIYAQFLHTRLSLSL
eukprot:jgi/Antlo1/2520/1150